MDEPLKVNDLHIKQQNILFLNARVRHILINELDIKEFNRVIDETLIMG